MVKSMTKEQEAKVPVYLKKWQDLGYRTKTTDRDKARKAIDFLYTDIMKREKPKYVVFLDSPMACQLACNLLKGTKLEGKQLYSQLYSQLGSQLYSQLGSQLRSQLYSQLRSQLDLQLSSQLRSQLDLQLRSQLYSQLGSQLRLQLDSQLYSQLDSQLDSQLSSQLDSQLSSQLRSQLDLQLRSQLDLQLRSQLELEYFGLGENLWYWAGYYSFYDFVLPELFPEKVSKFKLFEKFTKYWPELHAFWLFPEIAFVSDFPAEINTNDRFQLHADGKPALVYRDSYALYRLNGVTVTKEVAELKPSQIKRDTILKEENADVRREIVRKLTPEQLVKVLKAKVLEKKYGYELLAIDLGDKRARPFLKMNNPSMKGVVHIEGVPPGIETVEAALAWRNGLDNYNAPKELS